MRLNQSRDATRESLRSLALIVPPFLLLLFPLRSRQGAGLTAISALLKAPANHSLRSNLGQQALPLLLRCISCRRSLVRKNAYPLLRSKKAFHPVRRCAGKDGREHVLPTLPYLTGHGYLTFLSALCSNGGPRE